MNEDLVARGADGAQRAHEPAEDAVLVADVLMLKARNAVAGLLPPDDRVVVLVAGLEVAEERVIEALDHGARHARGGREVHVGDPHRNDVEALLRLEGGLGIRDVDGERVFAAAVIEGREVEGHGHLPWNRV